MSHFTKNFIDNFFIWFIKNFTCILIISILNRFQLYLKKPKSAASSYSYVSTLTPELWIFSGILFAILTMSVWLTIKILNKAFPLERNVSLFSCFLGTVGGFINQGRLTVNGKFSSKQIYVHIFTWSLTQYDVWDVFDRI